MPTGPISLNPKSKLMRPVSVAKISATETAPWSPICRKLRSKSVAPTDKLIMFSGNRSRCRMDQFLLWIPQELKSPRKISIGLPRTEIPQRDQGELERNSFVTSESTCFTLIGRINPTKCIVRLGASQRESSACPLGDPQLLGSRKVRAAHHRFYPPPVHQHYHIFTSVIIITAITTKYLVITKITVVAVTPPSSPIPPSW